MSTQHESTPQPEPHNENASETQPTRLIEEFALIPMDQVVVSAATKSLGLTVDDLAPMIASIQREGILQPPLATPNPDGTYRLISGNRRYLAAKAAGHTSIRLGIVAAETLASDPDLERTIALNEQLNRVDLNEADRILASLEYVRLRVGFEDHQAIARLLRRMKKGRVEVAEDERARLTTLAFEELGTSWKWFERAALPYLSLPEDVQWALRRGDIANVRVARLFAVVQDEAARARLIETATDAGLGFAEIRDLIEEYRMEDPRYAAAAFAMDVWEKHEHEMDEATRADFLALARAFARREPLPEIDLTPRPPAT